jgi:hypothetical protein
MSGFINKDGSNKGIDNIYVKVSDTWHLVAQGYVKVNGAWKEFHRIPPGAPVISSIVDNSSGRSFNNGNVTISFSLPAGSEPATSYDVDLTASGQTPVHTVVTSSPVEISGLASGVQYSVVVTANNSNYNTHTASSVYYVTPTTVPAQPSPPSAAAGVDSDSISWIAPANGGLPITNYNWESNDGKSGTTTDTTAAVAQEGSTSQAYRVRAYNANGWGEWSGWSGTITTTPPYFPYFPYFPWFPPWFPWFPPWFPWFPPWFPWFPWFPPYFRAGCIEANTLVLTVSGLVPAKDIKVGDKVITYEMNEKAPTTDAGTLFIWDSPSLSTSNMVETEVVRVVEKGDSAIMYFNGNTDAKYSITQPLFIKGSDGSYKIRTTGSLEVGDYLVSINDDGSIIEEEIVDITIEDELGLVYQIDCEPIQWFVAGGYLAHNK